MSNTALSAHQAVLFDLGRMLICHFEPGYDYFTHQRTGTLALYDFLIERGYDGLPPRDEFAEGSTRGLQQGHADTR